MNKLADNPQAFPCPTHIAHSGMTLLDWFAGKIASGMAAHSGTAGTSFGPDDIAKRSYEVARAMLAARAAALRAGDTDATG